MIGNIKQKSVRCPIHIHSCSRASKRDDKHWSKYVAKYANKYFVFKKFKKDKSTFVYWHIFLQSYVLVAPKWIIWKKETEDRVVYIGALLTLKTTQKIVLFHFQSVLSVYATWEEEKGQVSPFFGFGETFLAWLKINDWFFTHLQDCVFLGFLFYLESPLAIHTQLKLKFLPSYYWHTSKYNEKVFSQTKAKTRGEVWKTSGWTNNGWCNTGSRCTSWQTKGVSGCFEWL